MKDVFSQTLFKQIGKKQWTIVEYGDIILTEPFL